MSFTACGIGVLAALGIAVAVGNQSSRGPAWLLTPLAMLLPLIWYRHWLYRRHRPNFGQSPVPYLAIVSGAVSQTAVAFTAINVVVIALMVFGGTAASVVLLTAAAGCAAFWLPRVISQPRLEPLSGTAASHLQTLAEWTQVRTEFFIDPEGPDSNARSTRVNNRNAIVVTPALMNRSVELQSLVVTHELAHLKLGHLAKLRFLGAVQVVVATAATWMVGAALGQRLEEPRIYPVFVLSAVAIWVGGRLAASFVRRGFERQADAVSQQLLGTVGTDLGRQLHLTRFANLEPALWTKMMSNHPPPAERIELISRQVPTL